MKVIIRGRDQKQRNGISVGSPVKQEVGLLSGVRMVTMYLHYNHAIGICGKSWPQHWRLSPVEVMFARWVKFALFTKVKPTLVFGHGEELAVAFINELQLVYMRVLFLFVFCKVGDILQTIAGIILV